MQHCGKELRNTLISAARKTAGPSGEEYLSLPLEACKALSLKTGLNRKELEIAALEAEIIPERYQRSMGTLGIDGQLKLLRSSVGILGAGGLGGFVVELLARMGVGRLVIVDSDTFSESNLNRQLYSTENNLGQSKTDQAVERVISVNEAVEAVGHSCRGSADNLTDLFAGCDLAVDCLDNLPSRFALAEACKKMEIIMVHGAIAGFLGQIAVVRPESAVLEALYGSSRESGLERGVETQLGNPAYTPAMLASWQAGETVKILAGLDGVLPDGKMLMIDMQSGESYAVDLF